MSFSTRLQAAWSRTDSMLCVGLDPAPARFPASLPMGPDRIARFCIAIIDATAPYACAFKPQIAHFAAEGAEDQLEAVCEHVRRTHPDLPVILDAKRGDIGATAERYAREAFERYGADAVTVNPYMGHDSIAPWLEWTDRGVFLLCRTSNPGGDDLQSLPLADGTLLYERVAELAATRWHRAGQVGLVVGATYPAELARVRALAPGLPLLVPGIGAQGGDIEASVTAGCATQGYGMLINSSRAILYASAGEDYAEAAAAVARQTRDAIRQAAAG